MWLQVEEVATFDFLLVEKLYVAFSNFSRIIPRSQKNNQKLCYVFRWPSTHERPYVGVKISNIRSSVSRCSRSKHFSAYAGKCYCEKAYMLDVFLESRRGEVELNSRYQMTFHLGFFEFFFSFHSQYFRLFWNLTNVRIQFQCTNFVKNAH